MLSNHPPTGHQNVLLCGKTIIHSGAVLRGDLAKIKIGILQRNRAIGKYGVVKEEVVLRPTYKRHKGQLTYCTLDIGDYVYMDSGSIICASKIGSNVFIGKNVIIVTNFGSNSSLTDAS